MGRRIRDGEAWLEGVHVAPYAYAHGFGEHTPDRPRKLLLHRDEIRRLKALVDTERVALVPMSLYFRDGRVKVEIGVGKGRTKGDAPEIDGTVYLSARRPLRVGEIATVKIERADAYDLHGTVVGF